MYVSNSNPPEDIDAEGEIYKVDLTGKLLGTFGTRRPAREGIQRRSTSSSAATENELWAAEIGNWRVSKITLRGTRYELNPSSNCQIPNRNSRVPPRGLGFATSFGIGDFAAHVHLS